MAAPSYTTDLTSGLISDADNVTNWAEPTAVGWTSLSTITSPAETDYFIQGAACMSAAVKTGVGGLLFNYGSGITVPTDGAVLIWQYFGAPNCLDSETNGGIRIIIGNALTAFYGWKLGGVNTYTYGGWQCLACDPAQTPDYTAGSPTSTKQFFGWAYNCPTSVPGKGAPFGIDVMRYGRCESRMNGGDLANGYATFAGFAAVNDASSARWGLIQAIEGGYKWQGMMVLGYSSAVDFRDSNVTIVIANTKKVSSNFNRIEIRQATSRVDWTNINITSLGTVSRGNFEVIDNADVNIDTCVFTDMGTFTFLSGSTILTSTFRRCNLIATGGATFIGCTFDKTNDSTKAVIASSPANAALITNSTFISSGTKHGLEIGGSADNMTLTNVTWSGYASSNGSSGNEAIFFNIGAGTIDLTISGGSVPSIRTAGVTVNIIAGAVSATVTVKTSAGSNIENARVLVLAADGTGPMPYNVTVTISNSGTTATVTHSSHGMATNDKVQIKGASLWQNNGVFPITKINNDSYSYTLPNAPGSNPTGTIKATYVALFGLTNANGQITMSRVFSSAQPIIGRVRKSTGSPLYKTADVIGSISSSAGFSATVQMIPDE